MTFSTSITIITVPACAHNSCRPTQERPTGMDLILWVEVDTNFLLTESPVNVHGVQHNSLSLPSKFGNMSPLATSKPLKDEDEDEGKREIIEEVEAR